METLASDAFKGRKTATPGLLQASEYIIDYMKALEIDPFFEGSYYDTLDVRGKETYNIVGVINEDSPVEDYILIGAHLDHIGMVNSETDSIFNGANDNASGVAAVLQIAKELQKAEFKKKVIIALFTAEEMGLRGSKHLSAKLKAENTPLSYVINFDMIGTPLTSDSTKVYITGFDRSDFAELANDALGKEFIKQESIDMERPLFRMSDNYPFYQDFNIPSHTVSTFDFQNFQYFHHVKDEFSEIDIPHLEYVIEQFTSLILKMLEEDAVPVLTEETV